MSDVVVTVPMGMWDEWIAEGDLPGDDPQDSPLDPGDEWGFSTWGTKPDIELGERVYVVAHGRLRGYAPLTRLDFVEERGGQGYVTFGRRGGAVAVTLPDKIRGFRGWRWRWWSRQDERPFPEWKTEGVYE